MIVYLNGRFVPEEEALVSVFDRSFRYGDGLFEAVLAVNGKFFRWNEHCERLSHSADLLRFRLPLTNDELHAAAAGLLERNGLKQAMARIALSRGVGPRGYAPAGSEQPTIVITLHPAPVFCGDETWKLCTAPLRVPANDSLAHHKTSSRMLNVLAAMHAHEQGAHEAVFVDSDGCVTEGATSNLFWIQDATVCSAPLSASVLPGVTRRCVFVLCDELGIVRAERRIRREDLAETEGVFVSFTSRGIVEAESLDGTSLRRSPLVSRLRSAFRELLARECGVAGGPS